MEFLKNQIQRKEAGERKRHQKVEYNIWGAICRDMEYFVIRIERVLQQRFLFSVYHGPS